MKGETIISTVDRELEDQLIGGGISLRAHEGIIIQLEDVPEMVWVPD